MAIKPFRKCPQCGHYNTLDKDICVCGNRIRGLAPNMIDEALVYGSKKEETTKPAPAKDEPKVAEPAQKKPETPVPRAERSQATADSENVGKYIQTCPICRTEYIIDSVKDRKRQCTSCGKKRIGMIEPILLVDDDAAAPDPQPGNGSNPESPQPGNCSKPEGPQPGTNPKTEGPKPGTGPEPGTKQEHPGPITLASVPPFVGCRVSFTWKDAPILLGRGATLGDFLEQDGRVSYEHCTLCIENGAWHVKDNHSTNSTLVNNRKVSSETPMKLTKGCRLTLGNRMDSMEFEVETV